MGHYKKNTYLQVKAKERQAEKRLCPKCQRKSALKPWDQEIVWGVACRWCDYVRVTGEAKVD